MEFKMVALTNLPRDVIYLVPEHLDCSICNGYAYMTVTGDVVCKPRGHVTPLRDYIKKFGIITGVEWPNASNKSTEG